MNIKPYSYQLVSADEIPERRPRSGFGKWAWLRDVILNDLKPNGKAVKITLPNKRQAELCQTAAQNCSSAKAKTTAGRKLKPPHNVRTAKEPVDPKAPQGEYYVYVQVYTP